MSMNLSQRGTMRGTSSSSSYLDKAVRNTKRPGSLLKQVIRNTQQANTPLRRAIDETNRQQRRGKQSVPRVPLRKAVERVGLGLARKNPIVRVARIGFNYYYGFDTDSPWLSQDAGEGHWPFEEYGFQRCSGSAVFAPPRCTPGYNVQIGRFNEPLCTLIGQDLQVRHGSAGEPITVPSRTTQQSVSIQVGPGHTLGDCARFGVAAVYGLIRPNPGPEFQIPWRQPAPRSIPAPRTDPPPAAIEEQQNGPAPDYEPWPEPEYRAPQEKPYERPAINIELKPSAGPGPQPKPPITDGPHQLRPPGPNERERKQKVNARDALRLISAIYDHATEFKDILDEIYDCMGVKPPFRPGNAYKPHEKVNFIYENLEHLDVDCMVKGLIRNHFEDKYIYGRIFGTLGKYTPYGTQLPINNALRDVGKPEYNGPRPWWAY